jgi:uncharacterized protein
MGASVPSTSRMIAVRCGAWASGASRVVPSTPSTIGRVPLGRRSTMLCVGIGLLAGLFSALLGVGGGILIVPALIVFLALEPRAASGTSLAAIGITAAFGAIAYGVLGRIAWEEAALLGLPAIVGVLGGTSLQQRLSSQTLMYAFAAFLVAVAVQLLVR